MIYFVQSKCVEEFIKIGHAGSRCQPNNRFTTMQANTPHALWVLGVMDGDRAVESALHSRFAFARYRAEWFWPDSELLDFIHDNTRPYTLVDGRKQPKCDS
jgi:hypothetical protein